MSQRKHTEHIRTSKESRKNTVNILSLSSGQVGCPMFSLDFPTNLGPDGDAKGGVLQNVAWHLRQLASHPVVPPGITGGIISTCEGTLQ